MALYEQRIAQEEIDDKEEALRRRDALKLAPVKKEFLVLRRKRKFEEVTASDDARIETAAQSDAPTEPEKRPSKRQKKEAKKKLREEDLCHRLALGESCQAGDRCRKIHDVAKYLSKKPPDISNRCVLFEKYGFCRYGLRCLFSSAHTVDGKNVVNEELKSRVKPLAVYNTLPDELKDTLRKKKYTYRSVPVVEALKKRLSQKKSFLTDQAPASTPAESTNNPQTTLIELFSTDSEGILNLREKRKLDWRGKTYLAPLTTLGNLPFRRVCKRLGADITCGEMAVATNLLQGHPSEWALLKRHESEDIFGVQLAGSHPEPMMLAAELIADRCEKVDFIDINSGCPIDLMYNKGMGCALMERPLKVELMIRGMHAVSGDLPITIKMRTGKSDEQLSAHTLIPQLRQWGASAVTLHGRTRNQRYTREADWAYIERCADLAAATGLAFIGNGDIFNPTDVWERFPSGRYTALMVARGALIKPWVFTEVKEQRQWDISSSERLGLLREYVDYGLEHWGADAKGMETTRHFLLQWLSFLYRYVPLGILERPIRMTDRPPLYVGRDDLETLMASDDVRDWVKISEMLLGPVPQGFSFVPKHKSNAYTFEENG